MLVKFTKLLFILQPPICLKSLHFTSKTFYFTPVHVKIWLQILQKVRKYEFRYHKMCAEIYSVATKKTQKCFQKLQKVRRIEYSYYKKYAKIWSATTKNAHRYNGRNLNSTISCILV